MISKVIIASTNMGCLGGGNRAISAGSLKITSQYNQSLSVCFAREKQNDSVTSGKAN